MSTLVSNVAHAPAAQVADQPVAHPQKATSITPLAPSHATRVAPDTVKISTAAQALQELTESAAQTTREASAGDVQAKALLAKQAAAHATK